MDLLSGLNSQQQEAVQHTEGPLLILAGAGSGKTTVMTRRIAHLVTDLDVYSSSILAVTFTNNAANEMKERIQKLVGDDLTKGMWVGTFHSICLRILRRDAGLLGYDANFVIYDEDDKKKLLTDLAQKAQIDTKYLSPSALRSKISELKNKMVSPEEFARNAETDFRLKKIATVYTDYVKKLKESNAMDFDDIIINGLTLLANNTEVLDYYRRKFRYVMVDEYQDTNEPQFQLVRLLSSYHRNICVVGDDDQSIYGWRGADISNILNFEKEFEGARVIKLEQNYRSTKSIIACANNVIKHNIHRKSKTLFTELGTGEHVILCNTYDENAEAEFVCRQIKNLIDNEAYTTGEIAVMYRTNSQSRVLEDAFVKYGIKYNMIGSLRFYERKEIKDIISYLRFAVNEKDEQSLLRVVNVPPRGIGEKTIEKLQQVATENEIPLFAAMMDSADYNILTEKMCQRLTDFCNVFLEISALDGIMSPVEIIEHVLNKTGYMDWLKESSDKLKEDRIANIEEFVAAAAQYTNDNGEEATLSGFLENMALASDTDDLGKAGVSLMTIHAAKGCEYPAVFLTGLEQGLFPLSMDEEAKKEEERRLFYVGITRAKKRLFITHANSRWRFKDREQALPSEFLRELPKECIQYVNPTAQARQRVYTFDDDTPTERPIMSNYGKPTGSSFSHSKANPYASATASSQSPAPKSSAQPASSKYSVGARVKHNRYGEGTIKEIKSTGSVTVLVIAFDDVGIKQFDASLAVLKVL
ncbi:MAG: ATP-dependent DNA helicase PcrA [Clostridiales bacterium]|nr:ATP-dependent DNA helicase PcrA [Clostridiales bacterium]